MTNITIIGAGNSGLAMAAHLSLNGNIVKVWNRSYDNVKELISTRCIHLQGIINGDAYLECVTTNIEEALSNSNIILITTPATSHQELAQKMLPFLNSNMFVVLNPGRTFGILDFRNTLIQMGCSELPIIAETQTIIYTCRKISPTCANIITFKKGVLISGIDPYNNSLLIRKLPECLRDYFLPAKSMIDTSIGNVGMILHCAPVILNSGWIENPQKIFKYYYEGITPTVANFLDKLDYERIEISKKLGSPVESTADWLKRSYSLTGNNLYECIQNNESYKTIDAPTSLNHRYLFEDIPYGLVPLEAIGKNLGFSMETSGLVIDIASVLMNYNFRKNGRNLKRLGIENYSCEDIIKACGL